MAAIRAISRGVLISEWIKLRSVRSTYLSLLITIAAGIVLGIVDTSSTAQHWGTMTAQSRAGFDAVGSSFGGLPFGEFALGALGVLAISSEYGTGMICTTMTAVPRRGTILAAKALVVGGVTLALGELLAFTTFFLGQAMLVGKHLSVSLGDPGVLRAVSSGGLYLFVVAMVGLGLGAIIRHSAGAVAALFGLIYIAYGVARAFENWSTLPDRLLLPNASDVLAQVHASSAHPGRLPSVGMAYLDLVLYLVVFLGLGAWRVSRDP